MKKLSSVSTANLIAIFAVIIACHSLRISSQSNRMSEEAEFHARKSSAVTSLVKHKLNVERIKTEVYKLGINATNNVSVTVEKKELRERIDLALNRINKALIDIKSIENPTFLDRLGSLQIELAEIEMESSTLAEHLKSK